MIDDLEMEYQDRAHHQGRAYAAIWYAFHVLRALPELLFLGIHWRMTMFYNYLKTAFRNLKHYKVYSFINIVGLSVGLACCILIFMWVRYELSYDQFHENADSLYRVIRVSSTDPNETSVVTPAPLVPAIKEELPEVLAATRFMWGGRHLIRHGDRSFFEDGAIIVDGDFISMFSFRLIRGEASNVFDIPYSIVITPGMAEKYFGKEDPLGKVLLMDNQAPLTVTGVIEKPTNSIFDFNYILSFSIYRSAGYHMDDWGDVSYLSYVQLHEETSPDEVKEKLVAIMERHVPEYSKVRRLQRVRDIRYQYVRGRLFSFSAIAAIILGIACINFMNLATARSRTRILEISIRKVTGARRIQLISQFLGESFLMTCFAFSIALILTIILLPIFNTLTGSILALNRLLRVDTVLGLTGILLFTGFFAGLYPTLFFSSMRPIVGLADRGGRGPKRSIFRKVLVIVQFILSIGLIICTFVISEQLQFIRSHDLGYDKDNLIYITMQGGFKTRAETIKREMMKHPQIRTVTLINLMPNMYGWGTDSPSWEGKTEGTRVQFTVRSVDVDFDDTFGITVAEGRFFSEDYATDEQAFVLNEAAIRAIGMDSPIGKRFEYKYVNKYGPIIGIVKDFHFTSLHSEIEPLIMLVKPDEYRFMCFKVSPHDIDETLGFIRTIWKRYAPEFPFEFRFLDEALDRLYGSERRSADLMRLFSILAILISCLGLLGMVSFMLQNRTKEIGIRKVLGASIPSIFVKLTKEFVKWVAVANIIAWPAAYFLMHKWLQNYPYRTAIHWWIYILSGSLAMFIAVAVIALQVFKAAHANPVDALRYE